MVTPGSKIFFRKNSKGMPIPNSNIRQILKPYGNWDVVINVINSASPIPRLRFPGPNRYFVQLDITGTVIPGSMIASPTVPVGKYLEVFANGYITVTDDNATNPGLIPEDPEDLLAIPLILSKDFLDNGYRTNHVNK
jgi:hypothetical protein